MEHLSLAMNRLRSLDQKQLLVNHKIVTGNYVKFLELKVRDQEGFWTFQNLEDLNPMQAVECAIRCPPSISCLGLTFKNIV